MKKPILFSIVLLATAAGSNAQKTPVTVKTAFANKFPGVTVKKWEAEDGKYEANFLQNGKTMSATFSADGAWEETEMDIKSTELPAAAIGYIKTSYKGKTIKEAAIISTPSAAKMYEAEVNGSDLMFDETGKFIKVIKKAAEAKSSKD